MPRLELIEPKTDNGPGADILNGPLKSKQINIFKGVAVNAGVLEAFLGFAQGVKAGALTNEEHEIIALVCGQDRGCAYCLAAHTHVAKSLGMDEDDTINVRKGVGGTPKQQALIDFAKKILEKNGFVTADQLGAFRSAGYDDAAVVEVVGAIAVNTFTNMYNQVNQTEVDFPVAAKV